MKVSRNWLQKYFTEELPDGQQLADAFTFHSLEVDEQEGDLLDLKVLPDRAGYALSHRGVAYELAAALDRPLKYDPLREVLPNWPRSNILSVKIGDSKKCLRYIGAALRGVKVGPSPAWLKEALESVGQRSINNVVDATNYVMLNIGQPLHALDANKLEQGKALISDIKALPCYAISVRLAKPGEKMLALDEKEYELDESMLVIADDNAQAAIGIAGVKGGMPAAITEETKDIIIEAANFDGTSVRRTAQKLRLFTDASSRFQNRPSPELAAFGMRDVLALIQEVAGGEVEGVVDIYPNPAKLSPVSVTTHQINGLLGSSFSSDEVRDAFKRLSLPIETTTDTFVITVPFERTDIVIPEDLIEEVGRILGYDRLPLTELPPLVGVPDQARFRGIGRMKDQLVEQGFIEVSTQSFAKVGDVMLANPLDKNKPALRTSLKENLDEALAQAQQYAPLVLEPGEKPRLFEVGSVFPKEGENIELRMTEAPEAWGKDFPTVDNLSKAKLEEYGKDYKPKRYKLGPFKPFSQYPFIARDVSFWGNGKIEVNEVEKMIKQEAGESCIKISLFDTFEKEERISLAYRLIFQLFDRTLTDEGVNLQMEKVYAKLNSLGFEIR